MDFKDSMKNVGIQCKWQVYEYNISPNCYYYFSKKAIILIDNLSSSLKENKLYIKLCEKKI